jgi:hypothetical protein
VPIQGTVTLDITGQVIKADITGIASATAGQTFIADGSGSGAFQTPVATDSCSLATITQPQADTLGLEDLRVTICGTGDSAIDGKTVTLDKVSALFGNIPAATAPVM